MQATVETGNKLLKLNTLEASSFNIQIATKLKLFLHKKGVQVLVLNEHETIALHDFAFDNKQDLSFVHDYWPAVEQVLRLYPNAHLTNLIVNTEKLIAVPEGLYVNGRGTDLFNLVHVLEPHERLVLYQQQEQQIFWISAFPTALIAQIGNSVTLKPAIPDAINGFLHVPDLGYLNRLWIHLELNHLYITAFVQGNFYQTTINTISDLSDVLYFALLIARESGIDAQQGGVWISGIYPEISLKQMVNELANHFALAQLMPPKPKLTAHLPITSLNMPQWYILLNN